MRGAAAVGLWALACGAVTFLVVWGALSLTGPSERQPGPHAGQRYVTCRVDIRKGEVYLNDCNTFTR